MTTHLTVQLLDGFQISVNGTPPKGFHQPRLQSLLTYLLLHRGVSQSRQHIAFVFWPDSTEKQARTNLRGLLLLLRKSLPHAEQYLTLTTETAGWIENAPYTLDVAIFESSIANANNAHQTAQKKEWLHKAIDMYTGELLPGFYDDWILIERERLADLYCTALTQLADLHKEGRSYSVAITLTERLLAHDPLSEVAHQRLIHLHLLNEDRASALRAYHVCATTLREELGVDPAPSIQELHLRLLRLDDEPTDVKARSSSSIALPLIGRHPEWKQLTQWWQHAKKGNPKLVLIEGEAGIGKTRLAEELADVVRRQGIVALHGRAYAAEGAASYTPVAELLRSKVIHMHLSQLDELWLTEIARLLPELLTELPALPHPAAMTEEWQRRRFQEALVHGCLVAGQPLLLHCDDLQWWDGETLAWLQVLLNFEPDSRILVIGTIRTGEVDSSHPVHQLKAEFVRSDRCHTLSLNPLSPEEVITLTATIRQEDEAVFDSAQLYAETEGSPLFTVELARTAIQSAAGVGPSDNAPAEAPETQLPPKLQSVITSRLAQISDPARELLRVAAVIGRSFTYEILAASSNQDEDTLVDALDELWARQIIREQGGDQYDFSHDRIREVAYGEISGARRRLLHQRVAEGLEVIYQDALGEVGGLLAQHYEQAGNIVRTIGYLTLAGDRATAQLALDDALHYYSRILTHLPSDDHVRRYETRHKRMSIYRQQRHGAQLGLEIDLLRELVDSHLDVLPNPIKVQADLELHEAEYEDLQGNYAKAVGHAERAFWLTQRAEHPEIEAQAIIEWGRYLWGIGDLEQAASKIYEGTQKAKHIGRTDLQAKGLEMYSIVGMFAGMNTSEIADYLHQCLTIHKDNQNLIGQCNIYNKMGYLQVAEGDGNYDKAKQYYLEGIRLAAQFGGKWIELNLIRNLGLLYVYEGNHRKAVETLSDSLSRSRRDDVPYHELVSLMGLGYESFNRGDFEEAAVYYKQGLEVVEEIQLDQFLVRILSKLGLLCYYQDKKKEALAHLNRSVEIAQKFGDLRLEGQALCRLGHTLIGTKHINDAGTAYQRALNCHRQMKQINRSLEPLAGLAEIALEQGNHNEAQTIVDEIWTRLETHPMERTEEGLRVYRACYRVCEAKSDPRRRDILQIMYEQLQARAVTIDNSEHQRMFWEEMPGYQEIWLAINQSQ